MTPEEILKKAKDILAVRKAENDRIETCLEASVCPNCGETSPHEPVRRSNGGKKYVMYRFSCVFCGAHYEKQLGRDEWNVKVPYASSEPAETAKPETED